MKYHNIINRIIAGVRKNPSQVFVEGFLVYATFWIILEPIFSMISTTATQYLAGTLSFATLVLLSLVLGLLRSASPAEIEIKINGSAIRVVFGDLFTFDGVKVIPASKFLYETDVVVSSLQDKLIKKFLVLGEGAQGINKYTSALEEALAGKFCELVDNNSEQLLSNNNLKKKYPLGTTAQLILQEHVYYIFALTETELRNRIPPNNCDPQNLFLALENFWKEARKLNRSSEPLNIPLVGSGVAGVKLRPSSILEIILLSIENAIRQDGKITTEDIRIVLHPKYLEEINLTRVQEMWC